MIKKFFKFKGMLQSNGWTSPAYVGIDEKGIIRYLSQNAPDDAIAFEPVNGYVIPGFQNAHSHAFQYAMAGMAERHEPGTQDDFWSWREAMYGLALRVNPEQLGAIASVLYAEMLRSGYTHVAEFHYLHHDVGGTPYSNLAELGDQLLEAAQSAGIKITLIPVHYNKGGFGKTFHSRQRRFISNSIDDYFKLLDATKKSVANYSNARLGFGVHSLRAVDSEDVKKVYHEGPADLPFHMHLAEQLKEVSDCVEYLKTRPMNWLLDNMPVDERFFLVHCTHLDDKELQGLAKSGASAVLCPSTEGNLGDGIFRMTEYAKLNGSWAIGTDSHICLNPVEDLRWIDYAQRMLTHQRNAIADDGAALLFKNALINGRQAMGNNDRAYFDLGQSFDAVVYDADSPLISIAKKDNFLPVIIYTGSSSARLGTLVNGQWKVKNNRHINMEALQENLRNKFQ
jgi:formimidoylglutamate deiminase